LGINKLHCLYVGVLRDNDRGKQTTQEGKGLRKQTDQRNFRSGGNQQLSWFLNLILRKTLCRFDLWWLEPGHVANGRRTAKE